MVPLRPAPRVLLSMPIQQKVTLMQPAYRFTFFLLWSCTASLEASDAVSADIPAELVTVQRGAGSLMLLSRKDVRRELELIESQEESIASILETLPKRLTELVRGFSGLTKTDRLNRVRSFSERLQEDVDEVLLPHQLLRLHQIAFQLRVCAEDVGKAFSCTEVVDALELTEGQLAVLKNVEPDVTQNYRTGISRLQEQAQARMTSSLTLAQRAKWRDLAGQPFVKDPDIQVGAYRGDSKRSALQSNRK